MRGSTPPRCIYCRTDFTQPWKYCIPDIIIEVNSHTGDAKVKYGIIFINGPDHTKNKIVAKDIYQTKQLLKAHYKVFVLEPIEFSYLKLCNRRMVLIGFFYAVLYDWVYDLDYFESEGVKEIVQLAKAIEVQE